jgi:MscS family membrane protein
VALSAVPGLAIGLGASKLLGNLFAGLAIQADQHLRIGELCRVGEATGFVRKIGLRSIENQTQDSLITIPNAAADENTIQNYSKQLGNEECQGLSLSIDITDKLSTGQISELIRLTRIYTSNQQAFVKSFVSINRQDSQLVLDVYCLLQTKDLDTWAEYIELREAVLKRTLQFLSQVRLSRQILRLGLRTPADLIEKFPSILKGVVLEDPMLEFDGAHLRISDDCYNFILLYVAKHDTYGGFLHALDHLNTRIIRKYEELSLKMPYPTTKFITTVNES